MPQKCKNHHLRLIKVVYLIIISLGITVMVAACKPKEVDIPFETIEQREGPHNGHFYESNKPKLVVITQAKDVPWLVDGWVGDSQAKLQDMDYNQEFALVLLQGVEQSTGYGVQINRITRRGATVNIYAQFIQPDFQKPLLSEETSPYHLVNIEKAMKWGQDITFKVIVNGSVIISSKNYIP